jgi:hypothetical protein
MTEVTDLPMTVGTAAGLFTDISTGVFSAVSAGTLAIARTVAGGVAFFGDDKAMENSGSIYAQMDLPVMPGMALPANTTIGFSVHSGPSSTGATAFMPVSASKCYVGFRYADASAPITDIPMRDRYYANELTGDGSMFSDMIEQDNTKFDLMSPTTVEIKVTLTADITVDAFLSASQDDLTPIMEVLCVDLPYPVDAVTATTDEELFVRHVDASYYQNYFSASFGGVSAYSISEVSFKRVIASGYAIYGDEETDDNTGTLYAQMDLAAMPSKTLPTGTAFSFTVPVVISNDGTTYAFTAAGSSMKCFVGASFATTTNTVSADTMRERYYASLEGGSLNGDDDLFTDMFTATSTATVASSTVNISVTLDADWTLPAFLGNTKSNSNGDTLSPTIEILCVDLRYPALGTVSASDMIMSASIPSTELFSTSSASFSGVGVKPKEGLGNRSDALRRQVVAHHRRLRPR